MILYFNKQKVKELLTNVTEDPCSDFYKNKYNKLIGLNNSDTLESLPYLTRKDIANTHPDKRLYVPKQDVSFVSYTSGTTDGSPLVMYWSQVENYFFEPSLGTDSRTPLILHPALNKNFGHTFIQQCRQAKAPVTPVFADFQNFTQSAIIAEKTSADAMYTTPTIASMMHEQLVTHYDPTKILLLVLFSETLTPLKKELLHKQYPNAKISNVYASSEVGQILFYPCERMISEGSNEFHIIDKAIVALELSDEGELILTMDQNKAFPLIRYRTGDFFELVHKVELKVDISANHKSDTGPEYPMCSCGLNTPILRWAGRMDVDKLRLNGVEIKSEDIEYALRNCRDQIGDAYQLHFYSKKSEIDRLKETVQIIVEIATPKNLIQSEFAKIELSEKIKKSLLSEWRLTSTATLQTAVDKGLFIEPEIKFIEELSLKTLKVRHIVNHAG